MEEVKKGFKVICKNCGKEVDFNDKYDEENKDINIGCDYDANTWVYCSCGNAVDGY